MFQGLDALFQVFVEIDDAFFDRLVEAAELFLRPSQFQLQSLAAFGHRLILQGSTLDDLIENQAETLRREELLLDVVDDGAIELFHADMASLADRLALLLAPGAAVIGIGTLAAGCARAGHACAAGRANGKTGEECGSIDGARRHDLRIIGSEPRLHAVKELQGNDRRNINFDDVRGVFQAASPCITNAIRPFAGRVAGVLQNAMNRSDAEGRADTGPIATRIEPAACILDAQRTSDAVTFSVKPEDQADGFSFDWINLKALLDFRSAPLGFISPIAKRRTGAVPKTLLCRFSHGARHVLAVLARGVFIEDADDLTHQFLRRVIAGWLRDGDDLDTAFAEAADSELHLGAIAIEAREGMDADHVEATIGGAGFFQHALKDRSAVICGGRPRLNELIDHAPALRLAIAPGEIALGRDRHFPSSLPAGADPEIKGGALRFGCGGAGGRTESHIETPWRKDLLRVSAPVAKSS